MNFTYLEKKAMAHLLMSLAKADGHIDDNEIMIVVDLLKVDADLIVASAKVDAVDAINTIKAMHISKKLEFGAIVLKVAEADGFFHPKEKELADMFFDLTGLTEFLLAKQQYDNAVRNSQR